MLKTLMCGLTLSAALSVAADAIKCADALSGSPAKSAGTASSLSSTAPISSGWLGLFARMSEYRPWVGRTGENQPQISALDPAISSLTNVDDSLVTALKGWKLNLKTQSLPVEILQYHDTTLWSRQAMRVWVDSDLGNASVILFSGGRIEISLNSVMNTYAAPKVLSYRDILSQLQATSEQSAVDMNTLNDAGALEVSSNGIVMRGDREKTAAKRLTQAIVDFLQQEHANAPANPQMDPGYASRRLVQKETAAYIQKELGVTASPETKDVFDTSSKPLDSQSNRPSFYSSYVVNVRGVGQVRMYLGNGDYSPLGFARIDFKASPGSVLPSEAQIKEALGAQASTYIKNISSHGVGLLSVSFSTVPASKIDVAQQMIQQFVTALKNGSLVNRSAP